VSDWAAVFLGIIALATLATATIQIGALIVAGRLARRIERLAAQVEQEMQPIFRHLDAIGQEASRTASLASAQVERADALFTDLARRVESTVGSVQHTMATPARETVALFRGVQAALAVIRSGGPRRGRSGADDEDALFI
jgi:hypothetical protein